MAGAPIVWGSKKQSLIATSSTEAEISALTTAVREAECLRALCAELLNHHTPPLILYCDNQPAIHIANGAKPAARTMHFGVRYAAVNEAVERKIVSVRHMPGNDMVADALTKPLTGILFERFAAKLIA